MSLVRRAVGPTVPAPEYEARLAATRRAIKARKLAALLVAGPENIYYLTGLSHQGYFAFTLLVVPRTGPPLLVTREMERITVADQAWSCLHVPYLDGDDPAAAVVDAVGRVTEAGDHVGVEMSSMYLPVDVWLRFSAALADIELRDGSGVVDEIRRLKSPTEIECTRQAADASSAAMAAGVAAAEVDATERDVARAVYDAMIAAGSEYPGFVPLVRTRERFLHEHATWTDRTLHAGDTMLVELSGSVGRYHAPMSRTVYVGYRPPGARRAAELARAGLDVVVETLRPGVRAHDVYGEWKRVIDAGLGHSNYARHHCGYMVGIGFPPSWTGGPGVVGLRQGSDLRIAEGMTFHVLSWLLGQLPVDHLVSDTVLVTVHGGEILTAVDRTPLDVDPGGHEEAHF